MQPIIGIEGLRTPVFVVLDYLSTAALAVPIAAAGIFCLLQLREERRVATAVSALSAEHVERPKPLAVGDTISARGFAYRAETSARYSATLPEGTERERYLVDATSAIASALSRRPRWGEAWVIACHVDALKNGLGASETLGALRQSYRFSPFLRDSAEWRIRIVIDQWDRLDRATRTAGANEAILLARASTALGVHIHILTAGTPMEAAIAGRVWPEGGARVN